MTKHLHIPHYDQAEDALSYVLMEDWWGAPQDGIIQGKQASVGDALNKVRAKIMIYLRTDLHFWSPPIWVYSGLHLLWWYMQPRWWSKWCLVLALQWPFPVGDGGREEDKGGKKKWQIVLKIWCFDPIFPSCRTNSLVRATVSQGSLYSFLYGMHRMWRPSPWY